MRVLTKVSHDDHDLGSEYECPEGELLERLIAGGVVVPAAEWSYRYEKPASREGEERHQFTKRPEVPATPETRVAPPTAHEVLPEPETR